jgi:hypothetical protein
MIQIDMTGVSSGGWKVLEPGIYDGRITDVKMGKSKAGNPMLTVTVEAEGARIRDFWTLTPDALWRVKQSLTELGIEVPDGMFEFDPNDIVGMECSIQVVIDNYGGQDNNKIEHYNPDSTTSGESSEQGSFDWS